MFRRYELRFIREDGRIIRGPIFTKASYQKMEEVLRGMTSAEWATFVYHRNRIIIPKGTLGMGHGEIKPVGPLYTLIRWLRSS